jgi:hypothetical protein
VTHQVHTGRRSWLAVLPLAVAIVVAPLPAAAGEVQLQKQGPGIAASARKAAESTTLARSSARLSQDAQPQTDLGSGSFFKTKAGIIALVAVGVGLGVTLYSTSNDRVKSPGK